ncbi:hypothetical protein [Streptomyces sp. NPDC085937]|uniref:hypothetical protein n=1 Tax=Streptomyces sp. NPDC085937 TaxID=3365742 RepID=UPI0037D05230
MFRTTITRTDGTSSTGTATEAHALSLLRRAERWEHCAVEATRRGGAIIERRMWEGGIMRTRKIDLEPLTPLGSITPTMRGALDAIAARDAYLVTDAVDIFRSRNGRICAGLESIPPTASKRLVDRSLVVLGTPYPSTSNGYLPETRTPVRLSLSARLALHAKDHRTRTGEPLGYVKPMDVGLNAIGLNKGGRRGGTIYDGTSAASCTCRGWAGTFERRMFALDQARIHRQEATAALVRTL